MNIPIILRPATEEDVAQMIAISLADGSTTRWTAQQWVDIFDPQSPPRLVLVAQEAALSPTVHGFLVALCGPACGEAADFELENIAVHPSMRRQGIGRSLISALLDHARLVRAGRILLEVRESNVAAIRLYQSCGFTVLGNRREYYSNPVENALVMVHTL
jgi:ribosomal-protein-alanine N-acetyltransferase